MMNCPICKGPGGVVLFSSIAPCDSCKKLDYQVVADNRFTGNKIVFNFRKPLDGVTNEPLAIAITVSSANLSQECSDELRRKEWEASPGFIRWEKLAKLENHHEYWPEVEAGVFRGELDIAIPRGALFGSWWPEGERWILDSLPYHFNLKTGNGALGRSRSSIFMYRYYW